MAFFSFFTFGLGSNVYDDLNRLSTVSLQANAQGPVVEISRMYYDSYANRPSGMNYQVGHLSTLPAQSTLLNPQAMPSMSRTAVLDENQNKVKDLVAVMYYDNLGRVVQTIAKNHKDNTLEVSSTELDFVGRVMASKTSGQGIDIEQRSSYDNGGRLASICQKISPVATAALAPSGQG